LENLVADIRAHDDHLTTGFLGTGELLPVLSDRGRHDVAWRLAVQRSYPSWGFPVERGATTIWERWNSHEVARLGPGMNSFNHFCFGSVVRWYYEYLAGIRPDPERPGFEHFFVRPMPPEDLEWARAEHLSPYGRIRSAWWREGDRIRLEVTVPPNTTADVWVPGAAGPVTVGAGVHRFVEGGETGDDEE
jgi:alpha-L-rhamnosidase